jgi:uncharacterized membrane protein
LFTKVFYLPSIDALYWRINRLSDLESNKNLAGIGSILLMFPFVSIVGIILVFVGMKGFAEYYKDDRIYHDVLRGLIFLIIAAIAIAIMVPLFILGGAFNIFTFGPLGVGFGLVSFFVVIAVVFIFYLLAAMNLRKAFNALAEKSGEHMFETAGLLLFLGAILTIILVGFVLIFLAWVFATIAFFSIKVPQQPYSYTPSQASVPTIQATRFCSNCGAPQDPNATFCPHCGKQLPPP